MKQEAARVQAAIRDSRQARMSRHTLVAKRNAGCWREAVCVQVVLCCSLSVFRFRGRSAHIRYLVLVWTGKRWRGSASLADRTPLQGQLEACVCGCTRVWIAWIFALAIAYFVCHQAYACCKLTARWPQVVAMAVRLLQMTAAAGHFLQEGRPVQGVPPAGAGPRGAAGRVHGSRQGRSAVCTTALPCPTLPYPTLPLDIASLNFIYIFFVRMAKTCCVVCTEGRFAVDSD